MFRQRNGNCYFLGLGVLQKILSDSQNVRFNKRFQCEDIMSAIKQAFSASLRPVTPLHAFHRLCVKLNHTNDIQHRLNLVSNVVETISEGEKFYINRKLKVSFCDQKSVFLMKHLLYLN